MISPVSAQELMDLIEKGDDEPDSPRGGKVHVFDLREASEFSRGHVPSARHVPISHAGRWIPQRALTQEIVVLVDAAGAQDGPARQAAHALGHKWFRRLRYLAGGFATWQDAGLKVEEGGPTGPSANSFDGTTESFKRSGAVAWTSPEHPGTPDPTRSA